MTKVVASILVDWKAQMFQHKNSTSVAPKKTVRWSSITGLHWLLYIHHCPLIDVWGETNQWVEDGRILSS